MINIVISSEYITLGQFCKVADLINSGGEAKAFLASTSIQINNDLDNRRGRKLYKGDIVKVLGKAYLIC